MTKTAHIEGVDTLIDSITEEEALTRTCAQDVYGSGLDPASPACDSCSPDPNAQHSGALISPQPCPARFDQHDGVVEPGVRVALHGGRHVFAIADGGSV